MHDIITAYYPFTSCDVDTKPYNSEEAAIAALREAIKKLRMTDPVPKELEDAILHSFIFQEYVFEMPSFKIEVVSELNPDRPNYPPEPSILMPQNGVQLSFANEFEVNAHIPSYPQVGQVFDQLPATDEATLSAMLGSLSLYWLTGLTDQDRDKLQISLTHSAAIRLCTFAAGDYDIRMDGETIWVHSHLNFVQGMILNHLYKQGVDVIGAESRGCNIDLGEEVPA